MRRPGERSKGGLRPGATASLAVLLATALVGVVAFAHRGASPRRRSRGLPPPPPPRPPRLRTTPPLSSLARRLRPGRAPSTAGRFPRRLPRIDLGDGGVKPSPLNPAAPEMPPTTPAPSASSAVDYDKLLGDIAALRARVAAVGDSLFVARIALAVETDGSHARIGKMTVSLDDGLVYSAPANFHADDPAIIYEHAVAPGRHAVTVDIDRRDDRDESFKDSQHARFVVDVPADNKLTVTLRLGDDSDMGKNFPSDRSGKYDIRVRMKASAAPVNVKR